MAHRRIFLDTETTGHDVGDGGKIVDLAGIEVSPDGEVERKEQWYLNPGRDISEKARQIHGLGMADLADKPSFAAIVDEFLDFVRGAELLMHNAPFDVGFLNAELKQAGCEELIQDICLITDTLTLARDRHPGQRNSLQALCQRYNIEASERDKRHGALVDTDLLRQVFQYMMSGQTVINFDDDINHNGEANENRLLSEADRPGPLPVIEPNAEEWRHHRERLKTIAGHSDSGRSVWQENDGRESDANS